VKLKNYFVKQYNFKLMNKFQCTLVLTFITLCFALSSSYAQDGSLMAYGSLNYRENNNTGTRFGANPIGLGYFFNDHVVAGMNFAFDKEKNRLGEVTSKQYEVGPFYSDSWKIGDHFVLIAQVDAHYIWGTTAIDMSNAYGYNGYLTRIYPIASVLLGHGWALKAKFCELSFQQTKGTNANRTTDRTFVAGVNGSTIGIGVSKNFSLKKKTT
jgi:hypothetical protein